MGEMKYVGDPKASKEEKDRIMAPEHLIRVTSIEELMELAKMTVAVQRLFAERIKPLMTAGKALQVRVLRETLSFRSLAAVLWPDWPEPCRWSPPGNQIAGMVLCEEAAKVLGEDPEREPWLTGFPGRTGR